MKVKKEIIQQENIIIQLDRHDIEFLKMLDFEGICSGEIGNINVGDTVRIYCYNGNDIHE